MRRAPWLPIAGAALLVALPSAAQDKKKDAKKVAPAVLLALPLGVAPGKATKLTLRGRTLENAKEVRVLDGQGSAKLVAKGKSAPPDKLPPEKFGDTHVEVTLTAAEKPAGATVSLVVVTPEGETKPHAVLVGAAPPEKEPNDGFRQAQEVALPALIDGRVERPRDVDVFKVKGKAGQKLVAEVHAARHGSALDAMLYLYDGAGQQLASAGAPGDGQDARLEVTLPADGAYYLTLLDAHDSGGPLHAYRLAVR